MGNKGVFLKNSENEKIFPGRYVTGIREYINSVGRYKDIAIPSW